MDTVLVSPTEFFKNKITDASKELKIFLGQDLEFYVVNLLVDFINPQKMNAVAGGKNILDTPLFELLKSALETNDIHEQLRIYKCLGDTSLYFAGYFQEYFNRQTFDITYYINMGSFAYRNTAELLQRKKDQKYLYEDLSSNFNSLVDVLAQVSDTHKCKETHQDTLAVYDRWLKSNSDRLLKILQDRGIDPIRVDTKTSQ